MGALMDQRRRRALVAVTTLVGVTALASFAFAHNQSWRSRAAVDSALVNTAGDTVIEGRVISGQRPTCQIGREVHVYHARGAGPVDIATTHSNTAGEWQTTVGGLTAGDKVYALAETRVHNRGGHVHTCRAAPPSAKETVR